MFAVHTASNILRLLRVREKVPILEILLPLATLLANISKHYELSGYHQCLGRLNTINVWFSRNTDMNTAGLSKHASAYCCWHTTESMSTSRVCCKLHRYWQHYEYLKRFRYDVYTDSVGRPMVASIATRPFFSSWTAAALGIRVQKLRVSRPYSFRALGLLINGVVDGF